MRAINTTLLMVLWFTGLAGQERTWAAPSGDVFIEGVEGKNAKSARDIISKTVSDPTNLNELEKATATIYNTGLYNDVEIYFEEKGGKTNVIFKISPIRIIKAVTFTGNSAFSSADLLAEFGVFEGEGYSGDKVKTGIESVKKFYNLNGYLNATVAGDFTKNPGTSDLALNITVNEGPPCVIKDLAFKSVNNDLNRNLQKRFNKNIGKVFSQSLLTGLQTDINAALFDDHYLSASAAAPETVYDPLRTSVTLTYVLNDPYAFSLVFEGNKSFDDNRIKNELNLSPDNRLSASPLEDLTERILRFYKKQGYASVAVKYRENLFTQDYVRRITFTIDEGVKIHIKDIVVDGTISQPQKYYRNFILEHGGDLLDSGVYNSDDVDTAAKNLVIELQNQGYIAAKVTGMRTDFDKRRENANIHVTLDEGPRTFIDKITFHGSKNITPTDLEHAISLKTGAPLDLSAVEASAKRIIDLYQSRGYLEVQVANQGKSIIAYTADNTKATLTYEINEGPQITVSSVVIEGNTFTKEYVIRRELQFHPGEILTPDLLAYSEQRLQRLGFFTSIDIHTLEQDPTQGNRTVLVRVTERPPGVFKGGVGVNNDANFTMRSFAGFAYRNLFGTGRGINVRVEVDDKTSYNNFIQADANIGYTEPFAFGTENTVRLNLTRSRDLWWKDQGHGFTWAIDSAQGDVSLERDLTQQLKLVYNVYGFAQLNEFEIYNLTTSNQIDIATTGPTVLWDRRNDPFNPTRGDLYSLSLEYSNPVMGSTSQVDYLKAVAGYTRYDSVGRFVWANQVKGGYDWDQGGLIPAVETFVLGGPSTIRGFDPIQESIPRPQDLPMGPANPIIYPFYAVNSDEYFLLTKSEMRFPIYGNLGGAVFYDGGKVGFAGYNPQFTWRDSAGVGLRYNTPVGPVSLDYAAKLEVAPGESPGQWIFSFGVF